MTKEELFEELIEKCEKIYTGEEIEEIKNFIDYLISKRNK